DYAEVGGDARHRVMPAREAREIGAVRNLLAGPITASMLPDMMQNRKAEFARALADRIQQRIVGSPAREQLDADGAALDAPLDFRQRVLGVVRVDGHEHPYELTLALAQREHCVVP